MNEWADLATAVIAALPVIQAIAYRREDDARRRKDIAREALRRLREASEQTSVYLMQLRNGENKDLAKELRLSTLWKNCADSLREINPDLSSRCGLKGDYWKDPESWSVRDINAARIGLDRVVKETERLLILGVQPIEGQNG